MRYDQRTHCILPNFRPPDWHIPGVSGTMCGDCWLNSVQLVSSDQLTQLHVCIVRLLLERNGWERLAGSQAQGCCQHGTDLQQHFSVLI